MPLIKVICVGFIEFIRGVPLITMLFTASLLLAYFLPPGTNFDLILRVIILVTVFSAAYIAARLAGAEPVEAARAGHRLGGVVVCYPGAIIPRSAMPANILPGPGSSRKGSP